MSSAIRNRGTFAFISRSYYYSAGYFAIPAAGASDCHVE